MDYVRGGRARRLHSQCWDLAGWNALYWRAVACTERVRRDKRASKAEQLHAAWKGELLQYDARGHTLQSPAAYGEQLSVSLRNFVERINTLTCLKRAYVTQGLDDRLARSTPTIIRSFLGAFAYCARHLERISLFVQLEEADCEVRVSLLPG